MAKKPLFQLVVERLGVKEEGKARSLIMAGRVYADGQKLTTPGTLVNESVSISQKKTAPYVSRAGEKLYFAIKEFGLDLSGLVVVDIGSSTGGFSDCALQNGAVKVYAVDVGTNQLHYSLRSDRRVAVMEQTNVRDIKSAMFNPLPDLAVCDVSFISLRHVFAATSGICGTVLALIKPQFEATKEQMTGTGGLCPEHLHEQIIAAVKGHASVHGYELVKIAPCPVKGKQKGNVEYVSLWRKKQW